MARLSHRQRAAAFGNPCRGHYRRTVTTPWGLTVTCHELLVERFLTACDLAKRSSTWVPRRIDHYNCRPIRGATSYSLHSWPLAWDFFDKPYPQPVDVWGRTNAPNDAFLNAFRHFGFTPGGDFSSRKDWPHIEWADAPPTAPVDDEGSLLAWTTGR